MILGNHAAPESQRCGVIISTPIDGGPPSHTDLVQCIHCQRVWLWQPGSGRKRGFCTNCNGITCGCKRCDTCVHAEKQLELMEAGVPWELVNELAGRSVTVAVSL